MSAKKARVLYIPGFVNFEAEKGVAEYARAAGWILMGVADPGGGTGTGHGHAYDGVITLLTHPDSGHARFVEETSKPVVDMANAVPEIPASRVLRDNVGIARMAADHLIGQGIQHLAFLDVRGVWNAEEREKSFAVEARKQGRTYDYLDTTPASLSKVKQPIQWLAARLEKLPKPLGVMMAHDTGWPLLLAACQTASLTIPDQVAVVGVGNNEVLCELGELPLSSVEINYKRHGYEAAALLDRLMAGEAPPPSPIRVPPARVVVRRSSDVLAVKETSVRRAVAFMRDHYQDTSIAVDAVVKASGTSRGRLYSLFHKHLDRGISETLCGLRVEEAKRLLAQSEMKIHSVAIRTGFAGHEQLIRAFRRNTGLSPSAFRERARAGRVD